MFSQEAELELCRDDNEQLMTQYEREKLQRKAAEQVKQNEQIFSLHRVHIAEELSSHNKIWCRCRLTKGSHMSDIVINHLASPVLKQ